MISFQLRNFDGIKTNFRVKEVYASDNALTNINGIQKYKFLTVLLCGNNQLRDLDKFLDFMENFAFLEQLDLFGNPLAEEPDYRSRIIYHMPQVRILDRHMVTLQERQKAEKIMASTGKKERKPRVPHASLALKGFSTGEKDLYKEVG